MKTIILGARSNLTKSLKKEINNPIIFSSENIEKRDYFKKIPKKFNLIINLFYPTSKLENIDNYVNFFHKNIILSSNDFVVLCKDITAFENQFPEVNNFIGDLGFGLGGGDQVRLFDSNGLLVDKVKYDEEDPWPIHPDGTVFTLALIHPSLDNDLAENWNAPIGNGTPGAENSGDDDE